MRRIWGAHAPSRARFGALAETIFCLASPALNRLNRAMSFPAWRIAPWNFETPQRSAEGATQSGSGFQIVIRAFSAGHILFFNNPGALPQAALNTALLVD
jgi:hypothetical protein